MVTASQAYAVTRRVSAHPGPRTEGHAGARGQPSEPTVWSAHGPDDAARGWPPRPSARHGGATTTCLEGLRLVWGASGKGGTLLALAALPPGLTTDIPAPPTGECHSERGRDAAASRSERRSDTQTSSPSRLLPGPAGGAGPRSCLGPEGELGAQRATQVPSGDETATGEQSFIGRSPSTLQVLARQWSDGGRANHSQTVTSFHSASLTGSEEVRGQEAGSHLGVLVYSHPKNL